MVATSSANFICENMKVKKGRVIFIKIPNRRGLSVLGDQSKKIDTHAHLTPWTPESWDSLTRFTLKIGHLFKLLSLHNIG